MKPGDISADRNTLEMDIQLGEGQFIEFKESLDSKFPKELAAFANASGGTIYLGVTDKGEIKGVSVTNKLRSEIQDIARNCDPPVNITLTQHGNVVAVNVIEGKNKPHSCSSGFFMRMGANSQKMTRNEILELAIKSGNVRFDEQICTSFSWNDFDDDKFKYYLELAGISYNLERDEILKNLKVLTNEGFTNAGVLYFAKEPSRYIISSQIRCIHFHGDNRANILDKKVFDKGIIGNIEHAVEYLKDRIPVRYEIKAVRRTEHPEFPLDAYREAIINAIIHFDYYLGDMIAIEKLKSSIVINNKGELLFPKEQFGKRSEARNRLMADLLSRTEFMEKAGTGIKRVREACTANGNRVEFDFSDAFWTVIHSNVTDDTVNDATTPENVPENVPERIELLLKMIFKNNKVTIKEMSDQLDVDSKTIKRDLAKLKDQGIIERIGPDKGGRWVVIKKSGK